ncbi:MAG: UPF0147 family protein [Candidatus Methanospirareceae archaeon]
MKETEGSDIVKECIELLERITNDPTTPKNIRKSVNNIKNGLLGGKESLAVRAATAISTLVEMANDLNIPLHTRTLIWNIVSQLERVSVEK